MPLGTRTDIDDNRSWPGVDPDKLYLNSGKALYWCLLRESASNFRR